MTDEQNRGYEILIATGVWPEIAKDLSERYSLPRIVEITDYVINKLNYRHPGAGIVKALNNEWEIIEVDNDQVNALLANAAEDSVDES